MLGLSQALSSTLSEFSPKRGTCRKFWRSKVPVLVLSMVRELYFLMVLKQCPPFRGVDPMIHRHLLAVLALSGTLTLSGCLLDPEGPQAARLMVENTPSSSGAPTLCTEGLEGVVHIAGMEFRSDLVRPGEVWSTGVLDVRFGSRIEIEAVCYQEGGAVSSSRSVVPVPRSTAWPGVLISPVYEASLPDPRECPGRQLATSPCILY